MQRLIIYGSCQAKELGRILDASPRVRETYTVRVHWVGEQFENTNKWAGEIADADVVFMQEIPELVSYPLWHWNQSRARFIRFPYLTLPGLWPFDTARGVVDPEAVAIQQSGRGLEFHFQDRLLALMRRHISDKDARFAAYATLSSGGHTEIAAFLDEFNVQATFDRNVEALANKDAKWDLGIGAAIAAQCRSAQMFHTVTHPAAAVLRRLGGELMGRVGVSLEPQSDVWDSFSVYQVPVHPMVARALGANWALERVQWNFHGAKLSFEQYYRQYIDTFG